MVIHGHANNFRRTSIILGVAFILIWALAAPSQAAGITGRVIPQGLRSAEGILVYVVKAPISASAVSETEYVLDQRQLTFIPHIIPIMVGSKVEFPNNDKVAHNVFSLSRAKEFDLGSYEAGQSKTVVFDKPGVVDIRCDVHQEMNAFILVLKNPYFAVTDKEGRFDIPNLPAGSYQVKTWHEKLRTARQKVAVPENNDVSIQFKPKRGSAGVLYK